MTDFVLPTGELKLLRILSLAGVFLLLPFVSCGKDNPEERLSAYCVRECVIETADPEICDTRCKCAVEKLSSGLTSQEFSHLAARIASKDGADAEDLSRFNDAYQSCKPIK